jgi:catechol 2,3-dioxygenase-like lactoylglutathione lyase family enzyme
VIETHGVCHLNLRVRDLARSLRFYREVFGAVEVLREGDAFVIISTPGTRDAISLDADPESSGTPGVMGGITHVGFRVKRGSDIPAALEAVARAGGKVLRHGSDDGRVYAYVEDPDGYKIELFDE